MSSSKIPIELSIDEALVLFDFLSRFEKDDELAIRHAAEERILWDVLAVLEKGLNAPLSRDYGKLLAQARSAICPSE